MTSLACSRRIIHLLKSQSNIGSCINILNKYNVSCLSTITQPTKTNLINKINNYAKQSKCKYSSDEHKLRSEKDSDDVISGNTPEKLYRAMDILVLGHELEVLESYVETCSIAANELDITVNGVLEPKFINDRMTLLRSIHIYKKHRVQYEARTYRRVLQLKYLTHSTMNIYLEYIQRNIPYGVAMHVHKWEIEKLPKHIEKAMAENIPKVSEKDWEVQFQYMKKMENARNTTVHDYEEYKTTQQYLLGTTM